MDANQKYVVTTSRRAGPDVIAAARQKATEWDLIFVDRGGVSLEDSLGDAEAAFVFDHDGLSLSTGRSSLRFSLGTAALRLQSLSRGEPETLTRAAELRSGDRVLDATLGLGHDSLVAARAVGSRGTVVGVESSWALFTLFNEGYSYYTPHEDSGVIRPVLGDSREYLSAAAESSFDVVILDPMFENPKRSDGSFEILRKFANPASLDADWVQAAHRVAKRCVVVKADREASWFKSVGLEPVYSGGRTNWFRAANSF